MQAHDLPPVLTADDVASLMGCVPATVEDEARQRRLPGLKIGHVWRFPREALLQVLNARAMAQLGSDTVSPAPRGGGVKPLRVVAPDRAPTKQRRRMPPVLGEPPIGVGR